MEVDVEVDIDLSSPPIGAAVPAAIRQADVDPFAALDKAHTGELMAERVDDAVDFNADADAAEAAEMVKACEEILEREHDTLRQAKLHYTIARLCESPLDDLRRASVHYDEALTRAPDHLPTIRGARRTHIAGKNYAKALPLFDAEARLTADGTEKATLFLRKGRLFEDIMGERDDAFRAYTAAHEIDRTDVSVLKALEHRDLDEERWDGVVRHLERAANSVANDPRHRAAVLVDRARLIDTRRSDPEGAIEQFETALRLDPYATGAVSELKRLHHARRRWRDLIRVLHIEAEQSGDPLVRAMALYRVGRLHTHRLGNQREGANALAHAMAESPQDSVILVELAGLYEATEQWEPLLDVLHRLVSLMKEPSEKLGVLHRMGHINEMKLGNGPDAVRWYESALEISPSYLPAIQSLIALYSAAQDWQSVIRILLGEADQADDPERRADALSRIGDIYELKLEDPDRAIEHHSRALGQRPAHLPSFKSLDKLLAQAKRWRELVDLHERAVTLTEHKDRAIAHLFKIGAVYEDHLAEPKQAAHTYRRVLTLKPDELRAVHALQRATERAGRFEELVEAIEREVKMTPEDAQRVALLHRASEVLYDQLSDRDGALSRLRKALTLDPKYQPALTTLGTIYHRAGRWEDLFDTYRRQLELLPRGPSAIALLQKMGELAEERIGRDDDAIRCYRDALDIDPTHGPCLRALARCLTRRGDFAELVKVLELQHSGLSDPDARAKTSFLIGSVYEHRLENTDRAITAYEAALKASPGHRAALDALARLRTARAAWPTLVDDLEREATTSPDPLLVVSAWSRRGEILDRELSDTRRAIESYNHVLALQPDNVNALLALERLYRKSGGWTELVRVYAAQASVLSDPGARVGALREMARVQSLKRVGEAGDVRLALESILETRYEDPYALAALEDLALSMHDRSLLAGVDQRISETSRDSATRAAHKTRLAEYLEAIGDYNGAVENYRGALLDDPESFGATRGLSRVAEALDDPEALSEAARREANVTRAAEHAARLLVRSAAVRRHRLGDDAGAADDLERAIEFAPDHQDAAAELYEILVDARQEGRLVGLLSRAADEAKLPARKIDLWNRVAALQADRLNNLPGAINSLRRVLREHPGDLDTIRTLASVSARAGQWSESVELYSQIIKLTKDRELMRQTHLALADLFDRRLGERSRALVSLQAVLALDARNLAALTHMSEIHEKEGKLPQAVDAMRTVASIATDPDDRADALMRLAALERSAGDEGASATAVVEAAAITGPDSVAMNELRVRCQHEPSLHTGLVDALERYVEHAKPQGELLTRSILEIAQVKRDQMNDQRGALSTLDMGLRASKGDPTLRMNVAIMLRKMGRTDRAIREFSTLLDEDVANEGAWRELGATFDASGRAEHTRMVLGPLALLGVASAGEKQRLASWKPKWNTLPARSVTDAILDQHAPVKLTGSSIVEFLSVLRPGLPKLYPPDLESFGLSTRDKVSTKSGDPMRLLANEVAALFGVEEFDLYFHRIRTRGVAIELSEPVSILAPASIEEASTSEQVFMLSRAMMSIARGLHATEKLTPRELQVLLAAASRNVERGYGAGLTSEDFMDDQAKRILKAIPRRNRKALEDVASRYVTQPLVDFAEWLKHVRKNTDRAAAVLCDDVGAAVKVLRREHPDTSGLRGAELFKASPQLAELLRYWVSDEAMSFRTELGVIST